MYMQFTNYLSIFSHFTDDCKILKSSLNSHNLIKYDEENCCYTILNYCVILFYSTDAQPMIQPSTPLWPWTCMDKPPLRPPLLWRVSHSIWSPGASSVKGLHMLTVMQTQAKPHTPDQMWEVCQPSNLKSCQLAEPKYQNTPGLPLIPTLLLCCNWDFCETSNNTCGIWLWRGN